MEFFDFVKWKSLKLGFWPKPKIRGFLGSKMGQNGPKMGQNGAFLGVLGDF